MAGDNLYRYHPGNPMEYNIRLLSAEVDSIREATGGADYSVPAPTGGDDTSVIQAVMDAASSAATAAGKIFRVVFAPDEVYQTSGLFLRSNLDINLNGSHIKKISKTMGSNEFTFAQVAVFRTGPWSKNGNTWYGNADNITLRNGTLDTNNCDNRGVIELHGVRNFWADGLTLITSQWAQAWAIRGGGYAFFTNGGYGRPVVTTRT